MDAWTLKADQSDYVELARHLLATGIGCITTDDTPLAEALNDAVEY